MNRKLGSTLLVCYIHIQCIHIHAVHAEASWHDSRTWTLIMFTYILGLFGSWRLSWIWFRLRLLVGARALFWRFILEFSSLQQQTQHIICVSICGPLSTVALVSCGVATMIKEARASDRVLFSPTLPPCGIIAIFKRYPWNRATS